MFSISFGFGNLPSTFLLNNNELALFVWCNITLNMPPLPCIISTSNPNLRSNDSLTLRACKSYPQEVQYSIEIFI